MKNRSVFVALFAALIALTCFVAIPVGPLGVPIVIQNMMVILAGAILGVEGAAAVALYMLVGALGLPVFSGGRGGMAVYFGPTGGFIIGYFFASLAVGLMLGRPTITEKQTKMLYAKIIFSAIIGFVIIFIFGTARIMQIIMKSKSLTFSQALMPALMSGVIPFLPGFVVKLIILTPLAAKLRPIAARYINVSK